MGFMVSSAIVSPILSEFENYWYLDTFIFLVASGVFVSIRWKQIKKYWLWIAPPAVMFSSTAYLRESVPVIPVILCFLVLLAAYALPCVLINPMSHPLEDSVASGDDSHSSFRGPGVRLVRPDDNYSDQVGILPINRNRDHDISGIERSPSRLSRAFSAHDSDINLEEHNGPITIAIQRLVRSNALCLPWMSQTLSEDGDPLSRFARPDYPLRIERQDDYQPSSSDTQAADCSSSISVESSSPLLM